MFTNKGYVKFDAGKKRLGCRAVGRFSWATVVLGTCLQLDPPRMRSLLLRRSARTIVLLGPAVVECSAKDNVVYTPGGA